MEAPSLDRRLVAILAADVEGYSRLMAHDEETTLATLSSHRATVGAAISSTPSAAGTVLRCERRR